MGVGKRVSSTLKRWSAASDTGRSDLAVGKGTIGPPMSTASAGIAFAGRPNPLSEFLDIETDLVSRYVDFENMDEYPLFAAGLDTYAANATIPDTATGRSVWIDADDRMIRKILMDLLDRRIEMDDAVYGVTRNMCEYGVTYGEILVDHTGVVGVNYLPTATVRAVQSAKRRLVGYAQDTDGRFNFGNSSVISNLSAGKSGGVKGRAGVAFFEPFEMAVFKLKGRRIDSQYGESVLENARWVWRRLIIAEDTALVYKTTRAPARYAFYIDTGGLPPDEAKAALEDIRRAYKKRQILNKVTGKRDFRVNTPSSNDDFFIGTNGGRDSSRIEILSGPDYQAVEDLEYWRANGMMAMKIPAGQLGLQRQASRSTLSQEDVQFARHAMRVQRDTRKGIAHICRTHLMALGIDPDRCGRWSVQMTVPSQVFELAQIELRNAQADLAGRLRDWFPDPWIMQNVFRFTPDEANAISKDKKHDDRRVAMSNARTQADIAKEFPELGPEGAQSATDQAAVESQSAVAFMDAIRRRPDLLENLSAMDAVLDRLDALEDSQHSALRERRRRTADEVRKDRSSRQVQRRVAGNEGAKHR